VLIGIKFWAALKATRPSSIERLNARFGSTANLETL
jgi:hypothetical protein